MELLSIFLGEVKGGARDEDAAAVVEPRLARTDGCLPAGSVRSCECAWFSAP